MTTIIQVDAFTQRPFRGNPAAVCVLPAPAGEAWMQDVAAEMNLSETAFLYPQDDGFNLRWFTPAVEVDLCGHATLAAAHVLWEQGHLPPQTPARFFTKSGLLTAQRRDDWIELDFPAEPAARITFPPVLPEALAATPTFVGQNRLDLLVEVESEAIVREMRPNFNLLARLPQRGVIVTSRADSAEFDFVSRFFAPNVGINEDPVTGSAHCCLGPYWQNRLNKNALVGYQASARGGIVRVRPAGKRVALEGQAVTVLRAELV
ncbi:MAG: PhzF family phenazine biosynthesis protein [Chloroflexota bacterium]